LIEFSAFFSAMYLGIYIRFLSTPSWYTHHDTQLAGLVFAAVLSLSCSGMGLYRRSLSLEDYNLLARTCASFGIATVAVIAIYYLFPDVLIARSVLVYALVLAFLLMMLSRHLFYKLVNLTLLKKRILVIGSGNKALKLSATNDDFISKGFTIVGFLAMPDEISVVDDSQLITTNKSIIELVEELRIDEIVVALDMRRGMPVDALLDCKMSGYMIMDIISFYEREQGIISLENVYTGWFVFCDGFAQGGLRALGKRLFDLVASALLFVVTWPVMLLTTLAILLESGIYQPVLYRQVRVGAGNKHFEVLKFRSMKMDAEKNGAQWAQPEDDRITRVGRFIRKVRIDELPQLFNVIKGTMSFVGPRPERPEFVQGFEQRIPFYRERHRVKPGITGWAQLCYPYGANEIDALRKLEYDLYYVKNYSLFLDISIMFNTVEIVLWGKGAR
jgi:sugar transferase (PEP-CTERM system associated)